MANRVHAGVAVARERGTGNERLKLAESRAAGKWALLAVLIGCAAQPAQPEIGNHGRTQRLRAEATSIQNTQKPLCLALFWTGLARPVCGTGGGKAALTDGLENLPHWQARRLCPGATAALLRCDPQVGRVSFCGGGACAGILACRAFAAAGLAYAW